MAKILLVDDDGTILILVTRILENAGHTVTALEDPREALHAVAPDTWDAVISDFHMPHVDGSQLLDHIRKVAPETPVLFLTSNDQITLAVELVRRGADDFLVKPPVGEALLMRLERAITIRAQEQRIARIEEEQKLLELENRKLIRWREMYGAKDVAQTRQMIQLLSRNINQSGGFLWLDLLRSELEKPAEDGEHRISSMVLEMAVTAATGQKEILDYVTYIAELDTLELDPRAMALSELKTLVVEEVSRTAGELERPVTLAETGTTACSCQLDDSAVAVDSAVFRDILQELVVNAVKFSPEGSRMILEVCEHQNRGPKTLSVTLRNDARDTQTKDRHGKPITGIPYDYAELVFDLFYSIEAFPMEIPQERWRYGTGLYICRRLLHRMGAAIRAANGLDYTGDGPPRPYVQITMELPIQT